MESIGFVRGAELVCALGYDVRTACAAARAGLSRATGHPTFRVDSAAGDPAGEPVTVHMVPLVTQGFEGRARLFRIASALIQQAAKRRLFDGCERNRTTVYISARPSPDRNAAAAAEQLIRRALRDAGVASDFPCFVFGSGPIAIAQCLAAAQARFQSSLLDTAIVIAVDSLLDESELAELEKQGRLKIASQPAGLQPGEAGAVVRIDHKPCSYDGAAHSVRLVRARLTEQDDSNATSNHDSGTRLGKLLADDAAPAGGSAEPLWVIIDQTGETARAQQWGSALVQMKSSGHLGADPIVWLPAMSFGATRAVAGVLGLCVVGEAARRGYLAATQGAIVNTDDSGRHAAIWFRCEGMRPA